MMSAFQSARTLVRRLFLKTVSVSLSITMANRTIPFEFHMIFGASGYIALGLPTGVCNLLVAASILKYPAMRDRKELVILMGLALADGINLLCYAAAGVYRLCVVLLGFQYRLLTSWECLRLPHLLLWSFAAPLANQMLVTVSLDRMLLVALRAKYIGRLGPKYAWGVVGGLFAFNISFGMLAFALALARGYSSPALNAMCYSPYVYGSNHPISLLFEQYSKYSSSVFPFVSVVLFACVGPVYVYHRNKVTPVGSVSVEQQMQFQHKLTRSMALSCSATFLLACIPGRLGYVFLERDLMLLSRVCWLLVITNPMINVLIYHIAHRDMRTAMHGLLCCKILPVNVNLWPGNVTTKATRRKPDVKE